MAVCYCYSFSHTIAKLRTFRLICVKLVVNTHIFIVPSHAKYLRYHEWKLLSTVQLVKRANAFTYNHSNLRYLKTSSIVPVAVTGFAILVSIESIT